MTQERLASEVRLWNASHERSCWSNLYCDHNRFLISYENEGGLNASAMEADSMYVTAPDERPNVLLPFIVIL